jgi:hypothetical protein
MGRAAAARVAIGVALVLPLAGCMGSGGEQLGGGGGATPVVPVTPPTPVRTPRPLDPATDGETVAQSLAGGQTLNSSIATTSMTQSNGNTWTSGQSHHTSVRGAGRGSYEFSIGQPMDKYGTKPKVTFTAADAVAGSKDAWQRQWVENGYLGVTERHSLSLWNAGKGHRDGVGSNQEGQNFHKVLGYYWTASRGSQTTQTRGHVIIGNATSDENLARRTRVANYQGYYFINSVAQGGSDMGRPTEVRGNVEMTADFDSRSISGRSTSMEVRNGDAFVATGDSFTMNRTDINQGNTYAGLLSTDYIPLQGAEFRGRFYGGNANETAGTILSNSGGRASEGYFTASEYQ